MSQAATESRIAAQRTTDHLLLKSITPRGGKAIDVGTINVLLGPNNCGKSETLRDILRLAANVDLAVGERTTEEEPQPIVLSDLTFVPKLTVERLLHGLTIVDHVGDDPIVHGLSADLKTPLRREVKDDLKGVLVRPVMTARSAWMTPLGELMPLRMVYVDGTRSPELVEPSAASSPIRPPESLLQALQNAPASVHEVLSEAFSMIAGGPKVRLDDSERVSLTMRVAASFPEPTGDAVSDVRRQANTRALNQEGTGYQSLVALILTILLCRGRVILLDRPEAHLYPAQARRFGAWLAANAARLGCQLFLASNDRSLLAGLHEGAADVALLRLSRHDDQPGFHAIPATVGRALVRAPLLSSQHAAECLFREAAIVVPQDADRVLYETVARTSLRTENIAFLHTHGRANTSAVVKLIRQAGMPTYVVTELVDIFQSEETFKEVVQATTGKEVPTAWLATRERLAKEVAGEFDEKALAESAQEVESFLDQLQGDDANGDEASFDQPKADPWDKVRRERLDWLPPELRVWVEELIEDLKRERIFVSTKGKLQGWIDVEAADEAEWLGHALRALDAGKCPADLRAFVTDIITHIQTLSAPARATRTSNRAPSTPAG